MTTELGASLEQLEATHKELASERQNYFYLNRALENAMARSQRREQARWRRALSLVLTVVLSAVIGAASFAVFLWLYYRGVVTLGYGGLRASGQKLGAGAVKALDNCQG